MPNYVGMSESGSHSRNESVRKNRSPPENRKEGMSRTEAHCTGKELFWYKLEQELANFL